MTEQYGGPWNTQPAPTHPGPNTYPGQPGYPGQVPDPGQAGYPVQPYAGYSNVPLPVRDDYAPWIRRVGAFLIDQLPSLIGTVIFYTGYGLAMFSSLDTGSGAIDFRAGAVPMIIGGAILVLAAVWAVYNRWFVAGRTGQSLGKRVTKIVLIGEDTQAPVGPLNAFLRDLVHIVDGFAYVGYLWPLWDQKKQTFSDKIMKTVVITAPDQSQPVRTG